MLDAAGTPGEVLGPELIVPMWQVASLFQICNELMFQVMMGPTCQLTRDGFVGCQHQETHQCGKIQNKTININTPKEQRHHGVSRFLLVFPFLPTCSLYSQGCCVISSAQLAAGVPPRAAVPGHASSRCHSSAFMLPLSCPCSKFLFKHSS